MIYIAVALYRYSEALSIPQQMKNCRIKPDARTYGTLVSGLLKGGDTEHACAILVAAFSDGPGVEYDTFLRVCRQFPEMYQKCRERAWHVDAKGVIQRATACFSKSQHSQAHGNQQQLQHTSQHRYNNSNFNSGVALRHRKQ